MLTPIEFIHLLNTRIAAHRQKLDRTGNPPIRHTHSQIDRQHRSIIRLQAIWAMIAVSVGSMGQIAPVRANPLDFAGIRQSLERPSTNRQFLLSSEREPFLKVIAQTPTTPPNSPPPQPTNTVDGKLINNINPPTTVKIGATRRITLQQALDIASRNNRELQTARLTIDKSQTDVREAEAAKNVQVGLSSTLSAQGSPVITTPAPNQNTNLTTNASGIVEASYSLINNTLSKRIESAKAQVNFDKADLDRIQRRIKSDVITAYYDLQQSDSTIIINNAAVQDATRSLSDAQLQEKAGVGTRFDILRAQVQLANANQSLTNSQGQQRTARRRIAQLLSLDDTTDFQSADAVSQLGAWNSTLEDSILLAFKNRAEIRQQEFRKKLVSFQDEIRGDDSAQVSLFANYSLAKTISNNNPAQDGYSLGARLNWNFFDGGGSAARSSRRRINDDISDSQVIIVRNQVRFEVEQAFNTLGSSQKNIGTATQALQQAEESLKLARLRFQAGVGTQTDVIQSQTELARVRGNRITAILDYNRALSILRTATELAE